MCDASVAPPGLLKFIVAMYRGLVSTLRSRLRLELTPG
jgi:hypothetical protein